MQIPPALKNLLYRAWRGSIRHYGHHPQEILLWPPVETQKQLDDLVPRLHFHFASRRASLFDLVIPVTDPALRSPECTPGYLHDYGDRCRAQVVYTDGAPDGAGFLSLLRNYYGVLLTKPATQVTGGRVLQYLPNVVPFDPADVEMETFWVSKLLYTRSRRERRRNRRRLFDFITRLPRKPKAYLLCTGPSLARFKEFDFSDGYVIGCNSVVCNQELMEHARPDFIVASDPIFHFGPSVYAEEFRQDLADASRRHPFLFLTLDVYHHLIEAHLSMPHKRVCEVPLRGDTRADRLSRRWSVPRTGNILTMFMLPLAHTLARRVYIIGADGRQPGETYFWKHDPSSQLTDKMQAIKDCHPAFFEKRNYEDYYETHCQVLSRQIRQIEKEGGRVFSLTPSYIPALRRRPAKR